jgi:hypothetical protein
VPRDVDMEGKVMTQCETCKRLNYDAEYLELCDVLNRLGQHTIGDAIGRAMDRASVKKSRRGHVARAIRFFIGNIREARP